MVEGHAPIPEAPGRAFIPRRTRLAQKDFDEFGYTENCRCCEFLQTGIGGRQNHSDQCRLRIEAELIQTEDGQQRIGKKTKTELITGQPNLVKRSLQTKATMGNKLER